MGHLGNPAHPEVQEALQDAAARVRSAGKAPGILATSATDALRYRDWGYGFVAGAADLGLLLQAAKALLAQMAITKN